MRRMALPFVLLTVVSFMASGSSGATTTEKKVEVKKPADRVIVMYFHRTQRCPTCRRMGSYSEEAVKKGFPKQVNRGTVEFHYIDFQDKKNAALTKAYKIKSPALFLVKVEKNKPIVAKNLQDIWKKNQNKDGFLKYVRDNVIYLQKPLPKQTARKPKANVQPNKAK